MQSSRATVFAGFQFCNAAYQRPRNTEGEVTPRAPRAYQVMGNSFCNRTARLRNPALFPRCRSLSTQPGRLAASPSRGNSTVPRRLLGLHFGRRFGRCSKRGQLTASLHCARRYWRRTVVGCSPAMFRHHPIGEARSRAGSGPVAEVGGTPENPAKADVFLR
jgi:hypothetical protein